MEQDLDIEARGIGLYVKDEKQRGVKPLVVCVQIVSHMKSALFDRLPP